MSARGWRGVQGKKDICAHGGGVKQYGRPHSVEKLKYRIVWWGKGYTVGKALYWQKNASKKYVS